MNNIIAFDYMINEGLYKYHCDPWCRKPISEHYSSVERVNGQINYNGEIFVVSHSSGHSGMGGMSVGSPPDATIIRVKQ